MKEERGHALKWGENKKRDYKNFIKKFKFVSKFRMQKYESNFLCRLKDNYISIANRSSAYIDFTQLSFNKAIYENRCNRLITNFHDLNEIKQMKDAILSSNIEKVRSMIELKNFSLLEDIFQGNQITIFHFAIYYGQLEVLKLLLQLIKYHPNLHDILNLQDATGSTLMINAIVTTFATK